MNKHMFSALLAFFVVFSSIGSAAAQISVVVNKDNKQEISKDSIKDIFAAANFTWSNGNKIELIDQSGTATGKTFYKKALGKSVNQVRMIWTRLVLSGQASAPVKCANDKEVLAKVTASANAIGFVASGSVDDTVKEVLKIE